MSIFPFNSQSLSFCQFFCNFLLSSCLTNYFLEINLERLIGNTFDEPLVDLDVAVPLPSPSITFSQPNTLNPHSRSAMQTSSTSYLEEKGEMKENVGQPSVSRQVAGEMRRKRPSTSQPRAISSRSSSSTPVSTPLRSGNVGSRSQSSQSNTNPSEIKSQSSSSTPIARRKASKQSETVDDSIVEKRDLPQSYRNEVIEIFKKHFLWEGEIPYQYLRTDNRKLNSRPINPENVEKICHSMINNYGVDREQVICVVTPCARPRVKELLNQGDFSKVDLQVIGGNHTVAAMRKLSKVYKLTSNDLPTKVYFFQQDNDEVMKWCQLYSIILNDTGDSRAPIDFYQRFAVAYDNYKKFNKDMTAEEELFTLKGFLLKGKTALRQIKTIYNYGDEAVDLVTKILKKYKMNSQYKFIYVMNMRHADRIAILEQCLDSRSIMNNIQKECAKVKATYYIENYMLGRYNDFKGRRPEIKKGTAKNSYCDIEELQKMYEEFPDLKPLAKKYSAISFSKKTFYLPVALANEVQAILDNSTDRHQMDEEKHSYNWQLKSSFIKIVKEDLFGTSFINHIKDFKADLIILDPPYELLDKKWDKRWKLPEKKSLFNKLNPYIAESTTLVCFTHSDDRHEWKQAMEKELKMTVTNHYWIKKNIFVPGGPRTTSSVEEILIGRSKYLFI